MQFDSIAEQQEQEKIQRYKTASSSRLKNLKKIVLTSLANVVKVRLLE
mgnify:CR=1 FL=1